MKKALFDTVAVLPYTSGSVVDRLGYESAILAVTVRVYLKTQKRPKKC